MIPVDYLEYKPWKTLDQGTESMCQAYAHFGLLMEMIEQKYNKKVEFPIKEYFSVIERKFKYSPKNEGAKPRQWYFYDRAMREGWLTTKGDLVKISGFRLFKEVHNHNLIMQSLQQWSPVQIAVTTHHNYPLNFDGDILPPLPKKLMVRGGHEMFIIGFDRKKELYLVQNSWGEKVPPKWMPFDVFEKIAYHCFYINGLTLIK